ncbi:MAG: MauE/DoxX family redox-associated membrane protein [Bacteroidota bacterium]
MVMFTAYIVVITRFSEYTPCSCGGVLEKMSWDQHLVFNIGFCGVGFDRDRDLSERYSIANGNRTTPKTWKRVGTTFNI